MTSAPRKKTALTDPDNIMVVWQDDAPAAGKRPAKKAAAKVAGPKALPRRRPKSS